MVYSCEDCKHKFDDRDIKDSVFLVCPKCYSPMIDAKSISGERRRGF